MSLDHPDRVDSAGVRDGWAVLVLTHFGAWDDEDAQAEALRGKIAAAYARAESAAFLAAWYRLPARIELSCAAPPPPVIRELCRTHGVSIPGFEEV